MISKMYDMFHNPQMVKRIQKKLPILFHMADLECMRAGKIGMEVGTVREKILGSMLIYFFGEGNVDTDIPTTEREIDVKLYQTPISIKTITAKGNVFSGVKLSWTVDATSARTFAGSYQPKYDIILARIKWNSEGALYYIPKEVQQKVISKMGSSSYLKLPVA